MTLLEEIGTRTEEATEIASYLGAPARPHAINGAAVAIGPKKNTRLGATSRSPPPGSRSFTPNSHGEDRL